MRLPAGRVHQVLNRAAIVTRQRPLQRITPFAALFAAARSDDLFANEATQHEDFAGLYKLEQLMNEASGAKVHDEPTRSISVAESRRFSLSDVDWDLDDT